MMRDKSVYTCAACIKTQFLDYMSRFRRITQRAPVRFMKREWKQTQADAAERLALYADSVDKAEGHVRDLLKDKVADEDLWSAARRDYVDRLENNPDWALAKTFFNSVTRRIFGTIGVNQRIEFVSDCPIIPRVPPTENLVRRYPLSGRLENVIRQVLRDFTDVPFDNKYIEQILPTITERLKTVIDKRRAGHPVRIEMIRSAFYRGQGAYLIGRIVDGDRIVPIVMALLHPPGGVAIDAVVFDSDGVSIVFSYTRSAFHVAVDNPKELVDFLQSIIPAKPEAELYSTIGHFKHGKTILYRDLCRYTNTCGSERFNISPGKRGMVMVVFDLAGYETVFKLIRDRFDNPKKTTRGNVIAQYDFVFNHYRVGRLIEAHTFEHLSFDRCWFTDELLEILTTEAGQTVRVVNDRVIIDHAYLERRVTPLDIYLKTASDQKAESAVVDFGNAIKDLAFANIFPGDMLLKNFGVTRHGRVVFYDYDEIVPLTDCRFREIPPPRSFMEEMSDEPWYTVAENDVFPEEFSRFLGLSAAHRDLFLSRHADLLSTPFWINAQEEIRLGHIRHIRPYRSKYRLGLGI
jgi:isocitrate dehydrogenase kinase/phosphatase